MAALDELVTASKAYISNPFIDETAHAKARSQLRTAWTDAGSTVQQLVAADRASDAKRVVVALATLSRFEAEARLTVPAKLPVSDGLFSTLKVSRDVATSIAAAASRCVTELRKFVGSSKVAATVRADTWSATFGKSLYDGWKQRAELRKLNVLLRGETGTGKEILARAIQLGAIADDPEDDPPMADINAAAISKDLLESELFGHIKGAFTHAVVERRGLFEVADGGTLFLDEIADLHPDHQPRLLRVLQERRVARVGSDQQRDVDVRVIAATSRPLDKLIRSDRFREDLYHRLSGCEVQIPPLRDRREDVDVIARSVADRVQSSASQADDPNLAALLGHLKDYLWPGNVRELEQMVRAHVLSVPGPKSTIGDRVADPDDMREFVDKMRRCELKLEEVELTYIALVLKAENNNQTQTAHRLGINRDTLRSRLKKTGAGSDAKD